MSWDAAFDEMPGLEQSTNPDFWLKIFESNPDSLYSLLSDIYYISDYRTTGIRRKRDGNGSLADLWKLLQE